MGDLTADFAGDFTALAGDLAMGEVGSAGAFAGPTALFSAAIEPFSARNGGGFGAGDCIAFAGDLAGLAGDLAAFTALPLRSPKGDRAGDLEGPKDFTAPTTRPVDTFTSS